MEVDIIKKCEYVAIDENGVEYPLAHFNGSDCDGYYVNSVVHLGVKGKIITKPGKDKIYFKID